MYFADRVSVRGPHVRQTESSTLKFNKFVSSNRKNGKHVFTLNSSMNSRNVFHRNLPAWCHQQEELVKERFIFGCLQEHILQPVTGRIILIVSCECYKPSPSVICFNFVSKQKLKDWKQLLWHSYIFKDIFFVTPMKLFIIGHNVAVYYRPKC
jgi:hypothetical protein